MSKISNKLFVRRTFYIPFLLLPEWSTKRKTFLRITIPNIKNRFYSVENKNTMVWTLNPLLTF